MHSAQWFSGDLWAFVCKAARSHFRFLTPIVPVGENRQFFFGMGCMYLDLR
jgi:hypothetical protein